MKKAVITLWFLLMQLCVGSRKAAYKKADFFYQHKLLKKFGGLLASSQYSILSRAD